MEMDSLFNGNIVLVLKVEDVLETSVNLSNTTELLTT